MKRGPLLTSSRFAAVLLLPLLALVPSAPAQQSAPSLEEILNQLESNLRHYEDTVPSLFADEQVVSQVIPNSGDQTTITQATFRLRRVENPDHTNSLAESRDVRTINGKPANTEDLVGPVVLQGAFSGGLAIVSVSQKPCMRYKLRPLKPNRPDAPYIVEFESTFDPRHPANCILREDGMGRVFIDRTSRQITHIQLTAPRHVIFPATTTEGRYTPAVIGLWSVSVDYAPVQLGGRTFWLPSVIESTAADHNSARSGPSFWSFHARYTNYHKLEVTSRIVPGP